MIEESEIAHGAVLEVVKTSEIWVETEIRQEEIFNLNVGDPVMVMFEAIPMMEFAGRIRTISPDADEAMGTVKLILELLKPDPEIRSGYTSRIFFTKETVLSNRVTTLAPGLPKESVYCLDLESDEWKSSVHFDFESQLTCKVWVSENGLAKSINVTTGMVSGNWIEIKEGVVVGDDVIYSESVSFSDGLHIAE
jgi:multidrug efflux pump subunit AcrA (membrane-fusion protein)